MALRKLANVKARISLSLLTVCGLVLIFGCHPQSSLIRHGSGIYIASSADLKPDANPGPQKAIYAGTVIPVDVKTNTDNGIFTIDLRYQGVSMEQEQYKSSPTEFDLVNAAGEQYTPPLPLLRFPMNAGDAWKWSGQMVTGPTSRNASAQVSTREDKVDIGTLADALVVQVDMSMDSGANTPATRQLSFWFVKGKGIVKREFGASTSRVPAAASSNE